jgi:hypothetical protein
MLSPEQVEQAIQQLPGERVTAQTIQSRIVAAEYLVPNDSSMTICVLRLDNGFQVTGESACVDPANYRRDIGEQIAYNQAFNKCWMLFGFLLAEARFLRSEADILE